MSNRSLKNITVVKYEAFLELAGCKYIRTKGGHLIYTRADLWRPIVFQSHIDPVPERIIQSNNKTLGYTRKEFFDIINLDREVVRDGKVFTLSDVKLKGK